MKNPTRFPINVILDNIRSAYNVGSFFRTSDAARIRKLYLCGITCYPPHNKIPKTALGAQDSVPWEHNKNTEEVIKKLKKQGNQIVAVEQTPDAVSYWEFKYKKPCTLIFGNEINGVGEDILKLADAKVYIPMYGKKKSLNVVVSFGVVLYEVLRRIKIKN